MKQSVNYFHGSKKMLVGMLEWERWMDIKELKNNGSNVLWEQF